MEHNIPVPNHQPEQVISWGNGLVKPGMHPLVGPKQL